MSSALCCQFKQFTCFCYTLHHYWCITQPVCICSMYVLLWSLRKLPDVNQAPNASPFPVESKVALTGQHVWTCISKSNSGPSNSPSAAGFLLPVPFHNASYSFIHYWCCVVLKLAAFLNNTLLPLNIIMSIGNFRIFRCITTQKRLSSIQHSAVQVCISEQTAHSHFSVFVLFRQSATHMGELNNGEKKWRPQSKMKNI